MLPALLMLTALPGDLGVARLELSTGRADIVSAAGVTSLVGRSAAQDVDGRAYLELGAASQLALRWRGEASLELRGAAAVEWRAPADQRGVLFTAWRVSELDFEVRRGPLRLDVGGGWRLELDVGAAGLRTLADGRLEVRHVAGAPLRIARDLGDGLVTPPWTLLPGGEVRLDAGALGAAGSRGAASGAEFRGRALGPPAPGGERFAPAAPWSQFAWPWAAPARPALPAPWPARSASEQTDSAAPARIESGRIAPASSSHEAQPERSDAAREPGREHTFENGAATAPAVVPEPRIELPQVRSRARDASAPAALPSAGAVPTPQPPAAPATHDGASAGGAAPSSDATDQRAVEPAAPEFAPTVDAGRAGSQADSAAQARGAAELDRALALALRMALLVQRSAPCGFAFAAAPTPPAPVRVPFDASRFAPLRREGELVLTPFGPRWSERP